MAGEAIGVNTLRVSQTASGQPVSGAGFAVSAAEFAGLLGVVRPLFQRRPHPRRQAPRQSPTWTPDSHMDGRTHLDARPHLGCGSNTNYLLTDMDAGADMDT